MRFFDTNVLVYAQDDSNPRKREIAIEIIFHALEANHDGVTVQAQVADAKMRAAGY